MFRTLDRYVIREILPPFALALLVFTFILALPPVMDHLENLLAKGVSWKTAGLIVLNLIPQSLGITIPMALLVGLLVGLGRLSADREAVALLACGVSPYRLLRPVLALAAAAAAATMWVLVVAIPDANQRFREITWEIISTRVANDIRPRVFFEDFPGWTLYVRDDVEGVAGWRHVMVADTSRPDATVLFLADRGALVLDRDTRRVDLVLTDGVRYSTSPKGETETYRFPGDLIVGLNPDSVFPRLELPRGISELPISELRRQADEKLAHGIPAHNEIMAIHAKFSIPAACFVFAFIGLALGVTVARDGKFSGFVVGIAVIFAYYVLMFLSESFAKGQQMPADLARWVPNLVLGPLGIAALVWRARHAAGGVAIPVPSALGRLFRSRSRATEVPAAGVPTGSSSRRDRVVLVVKLPRLRLPGPGLLDQYIARLYLRVAGLSFLALLGLFYIATFIDRSDKVFKGEATPGMVVQLMVLQTPQFVYYIIPIAALLSALVTFGLLSRTSELTVMKACGVSLYRAAASVIVLSLAFSALLFGLEQQVLAQANRQADRLDAEIRGRTPRAFNSLNRRWIVGRDGSTIYHYGLFDPDNRQFTALAIYSLDSKAWRLDRQTFAGRVRYEPGWRGYAGWTRDFQSSPPAWQPFTERALPLEEPDYFETEPPLAEMMTVAQLRRYVAELSASGFYVTPLVVELHRKLAFPFVTLVMTLLAIPFGVTTGRRGALYGIGLGIVIALTYWITSSGFVAVGKAGLLSPALAAWTPNILVVGCAAFLFLRTRT